MTESLLSPSSVMLYGRVMTDLSFKRSTTEGLSGNEFLRQQLGRISGKDGARKPQLARIYGFSYEGHYYDLARPTIFVVHGPGVSAQPQHKGAGAKTPVAGVVPPGSTDQSGVAAKGWDMMEDIFTWTYDRGDFSLRLDVESGTLEDILLEVELDEESSEAFYSGSRARVSGSRARVSGSRARVSGSRARARDRGD